MFLLQTWIVFVNSNGKIVVASKTDRHLTMIQSFKSYVGSRGHDSFFSHKSSGAYVFRPKSRALDLSYTGYYKIFKGMK